MQLNEKQKKNIVKTCEVAFQKLSSKLIYWWDPGIKIIFYFVTKQDKIIIF